MVFDFTVSTDMATTTSARAPSIFLGFAAVSRDCSLMLPTSILRVHTLGKLVVVIAAVDVKIGREAQVYHRTTCPVRSSRASQRRHALPTSWMGRRGHSSSSNDIDGILAKVLT